MQSLFKHITDEIIEAIEQGVDQFVMPWHTSAAVTPSNATSNQNYRGINALILWAEASRAGYRSSRWATYRQWTALGAQVRKGEHATTVLFWKSQHRDEDPARAGSESEVPYRFIARAFRVFNADQVDGFDEAPVAELDDSERITHAERFFRSLPAAVWYGGDSAFYDPRSDIVSVPNFERFRTAEGFYSVLAHEVVHWSGANHRLGRDLKNRFGSEAYAMEELIAEIGAAFLGARIGLSIEPRKDHAPYIADWLKVLRNDPRAIITAASKAQIAVDYLIDLAASASPIAEGEKAA